MLKAKMHEPAKLLTSEEELTRWLLLHLTSATDPGHVKAEAS